MRINKAYSKGSIVVIIASVMAIILMNHDVFTNGKLNINEGQAGFATLLLLISIVSKVFTRIGEIRILVAAVYAGLIFVSVIFYWDIVVCWLFYGFNGASLPATYYIGVILNTIVFFSSFKPFWKAIEKFYE